MAGIGRVADTVIALDGGYELYPGARPRSHPQQSEAIIAAAETADIELLLYRPADVYRNNEVEKRNLALRLASTILEPEKDWVMVVDADYHVLRCDPELIRARLDATRANVATYTLLDGKDFLEEPKLAEYVNGREVDSEWTVRVRDLYRWNPTLKVGPAHWTYSAVIDGERRWLRGPWEGQSEALDMNRDLVFYHRTQDRSHVRKKAAEGYYHLRHEQRIEWMDDYDPPTEENQAAALAAAEAA